MYIVEVIPLTTLPPNIPQILTYYYDSELKKGAVVEVTLNHRNITGVVISSNLVQSQKILLKKSVFQLKKLSNVLSDLPQVSESQFKIALWLANNYAAPLGLALKSVLPPFFLKKKYPINITQKLTEISSPQPMWVIARAKESFSESSGEIRRAAREGQVLIIVPEISYIEFFKKQLDSQNTGVVNSQISNEEWYRVWQKVNEGNLKMIVGTRQALFLPFNNLKLIVVVDPLHEFYKSDLSPKYRTPDLAEFIANLYGARILSLSNILGVEGYFQVSTKNLTCHDALARWSSEIDIVDMIAEVKQQHIGIFSPRVKEKIIENIKENKKVLILAARRGYSGILLCEHCGYAFKCPNCEIPMRIHQGPELILMCHRCNTTVAYPKFCPNCRSSQIKPTGPAGSQKIFAELQKWIEYGQMPNVPTIILDADVTQNQTEEDEVIESAKKDKSIIIIATQKIFSYIYDQTFDYIVIPQFDALTVGSDYRTNEYVWRQLEQIADFNPTEISIQTFHHKNLIPLITNHEYSSLYSEELKSRADFSYPPFSTLIKLTYSNLNPNTVVQEGRHAIEKLKMAATHLRQRDHIFISESSRAFLKKDKGYYVYTILIKALPTTSNIREFLRFVPTQWLIDVNPREAI
jgi:primosomal protein N' (replication factor Y)